ncbi:hypothetical protein L0668_10635 [Paraglaciecola aquimarina]|uniref:YdhG-like domain-containing protein n=1 Tax=Paraglaciecola algarum TaxID=3050085 RepID=A0ABS9D9U9_9ALTE|nr:hypothetical protein [Paraglaciecola sp. G1-23]MCF2948564.1 hypothetical protein [Paraglaciecola sp. G1-23]
MTPDIRAAFANFSTEVTKQLVMIRTWIFEIAHANDDIGKVQECLKWNEPSYLTSSPKSGTTLRISQVDEHHYGLFVHCQTSLIEEFKLAYPDLTYDKNRGVIFDARNSKQENAIKQFIYMALTYHVRKLNNKRENILNHTGHRQH